MIMDKLWIISLILSTAHKTTSKSNEKEILSIHAIQIILRPRYCELTVRENAY